MASNTATASSLTASSVAGVAAGRVTKDFLLGAAYKTATGGRLDEATRIALSLSAVAVAPTVLSWIGDLAKATMRVLRNKAGVLSVARAAAKRRHDPRASEPVVEARATFRPVPEFWRGLLARRDEFRLRFCRSPSVRLTQLDCVRTERAETWEVVTLTLTLASTPSPSTVDVMIACPLSVTWRDENGRSEIVDVAPCDPVGVSRTLADRVPFDAFREDLKKLVGDAMSGLADEDLVDRDVVFVGKKGVPREPDGFTSNFWNVLRRSVAFGSEVDRVASLSQLEHLLALTFNGTWMDSAYVKHYEFMSRDWKADGSHSFLGVDMTGTNPCLGMKHEFPATTLASLTVCGTLRQAGDVRRWLLAQLFPEKIVFDGVTDERKKEVKDFAVRMYGTGANATAPAMHAAFEAFASDLVVHAGRGDGGGVNKVKVSIVGFGDVAPLDADPDADPGTERKIRVTPVNEVSRDLSTIHLPRADKAKLASALHMFAHRKELLRRLGMPNKLGVLLYGAPGCGKSSTAMAIATSLGRPIFFVDLSSLRNDAELREAFEAARNAAVPGGVVVLEDIDASSDVLHRRDASAAPEAAPAASAAQAASASTSAVATTIGEAMVAAIVGGLAEKSDWPPRPVRPGFTLSCMLNLLQGPLTADDSVFVATTNHLDKLDPALVRDGRFDVKIELRPCDRDQVADIYAEFMGRPAPRHLIDRVPPGVHTPAEVMGELVRYVVCPDACSDEDALAPFLEHDGM